MINGSSFSDCKCQIHKIETIGVLILIIANVTINITTSILEVMSYYFDLDVLSAANDFILFLFSLVLTIIELFLYVNLKKAMSNSLHFYYQKYKYSIRYLSLVNFWYLIGLDLYNIFDILYTFIWAYYQTASWSQTVNDYFVSTLLILKFIQYTLLLIYLAYHSHNIKFAEWMVDLMIGHKQINKYGECSIFIYRSDLFMRRKHEENSDVLPSINDNEDEIEDIKIDYDDSNHYMKTFLAKIQNNASE